LLALAHQILSRRNIRVPENRIRNVCFTHGRGNMVHDIYSIDRPSLKLSIGHTPLKKFSTPVNQLPGIGGFDRRPSQRQEAHIMSRVEESESQPGPDKPGTTCDQQEHRDFCSASLAMKCTTY
jgi:hypothetical protein